MDPSPSSSRQNSRWSRVAFLGRYGVTWIALFQVGLVLAAHPDADARALLMYFLPPMAASLFLIADNGRFERSVVRGAWLLLAVNTLALLLARMDILPLQPQFGGALPARMDRVLVHHLASWYLFVLVVCPGWFLYWRIVGDGRKGGIISWPFTVGWLGYSFVVGTMAILAGKKLFL